MPVIPPGSWLSPEERPDGCAFSAAGRFSVPLEGARFDRHHHDEDELWFISSGKGKIFTDGHEHYVQAGDIVLTRRGDVHDFLEVYEAVTGFFTEAGLEPGGRWGHLDPTPHDVPALPLPADFPVR